ncbi:hypothetical protein SEA_SISKO_76 [Gordonia phage Sisko]|nr:hypothetical protein SEA_SISKO_76 [Gordonia phage Sisko]
MNWPWLDPALLPTMRCARGGIRYDHTITDKGEITMGFMENVSTAELRARAQGHRAEAARLEAEAARVEQAAEQRRALRRFKPVPPISSLDLGTDSGGINAVITFTRVLGGRTYNYAAVGWVDKRRRKTLWSITGEESGRYTWAELLDFIEAENWRSMKVVAVEAELSVRDTKGQGGKYTWAGADAKVAAERAAAEVPQASPFRAQEHRPAATESLAGHQAPIVHHTEYARGGPVLTGGEGLGDFDGCGNGPY